MDGTASAREARDGRGYKVPNGAIFTTVDDLARFVSFLLGHGPERVLPRARLDSIFTAAAASAPASGSGYGTGFSVERVGTSTWFGHGGAVAGYSASMVFDRDRQLGVVVLRSALGGRANPTRLAGEVLASLTKAGAGTDVR
jgi:D-alanyl-D-alanine carboxypeptidase